MVRFAALWNSHPTIQGNKAPCTTNGKKNFVNQCAIRLGTALASHGVDTTRLVSKARHCWQHGASVGHVLSAEELAHGLTRHPVAGIGKKIDVDPLEFQTALSQKKGIIFFKDFYARDGEDFRNRSGDHIDLWNGSRLTDWWTWVLISSTFGTGGSYSSSKEIWFWSIT